MVEAQADKVTQFLMGNVTGVVADRIRQKIVAPPETQGLIGDGFKHYHGAILSYTIHEAMGSPFMHGLSTSFLIMEMAGADPFGMNDPPEVKGKSYALTVGLFGLLMVVEAATRFGTRS